LGHHGGVDISRNDRPPPTLMVLRGFRRRCPRCGSKGLFTGWLKMVDDCPGCSYHFEREEGFFLGALVMNVILTELFMIGLLIVGFVTTLPDPPVARLAIGGTILTLVAPTFFYPFTKTIWTAVDMIMTKSMGDAYGESGRQKGFQPTKVK
jgi:uncharacterized protein (DUF983 family)